MNDSTRLKPEPLRRKLLLAAASLPLSMLPEVCGAAAGRDAGAAQARLAQIEAGMDGRLGLYALDTASGAALAYRDMEAFPMCSTFKLMLAGAILGRSVAMDGLLRQRIPYGRSRLVSYSPVTERHAGRGMTVSALCAAALRYSDNTAANLLLELLGGPAALTAYARSLGDRQFRLDRWETELNAAIPGDARDTTTPGAMAGSLRQLALGHALPPRQRMQLQDWLIGNTTGAARIRAGIPGDWRVGDKTGSGSYGTANDVALLWPPRRGPVVLAIYTTRHDREAESRNDAIAAAARVVADWL